MVPQILVVCTGNVCRSPYIERRLKSISDSVWGEGRLRFASAGTGALVGAPIDPTSGYLLDRLGIAHDDFRARQISAEDVAGSELVLTVTREHRGRVPRLWPRAIRYTFALADFADLIDQVPNDELPDTDEPLGYLRELVAVAGRQRGRRPTLPDDVADIVDPYRRAECVFLTMEQQVERWLPALGRALGQAAP